MQRFELDGRKFWEVFVDGATLTTRAGKLGGEPTLRAQRFASPAAAEAARDKLVAEKRAKGFQHVGTAKLQKAPKQTSVQVTVLPALRQPRASGTIDPDELVVKTLRRRGGRIGRILVSGTRVLGVGEQCVVSSNGERFHRRRSPGESFCVFEHGDAVYSLGNDLAVTRDFGVSWTRIPTPEDPWYKFCLFRDRRGTWWMGADLGQIFTAPSLEGPWTKAPLSGHRKILDIAEIDGRMLFFGDGCYSWDGTSRVRLTGIAKDHIICRVTMAPSGAWIAVGDGGVVYRSSDRGVTWKLVASDLTPDLEDVAWVAGSLFVVGSRGALLRSDDEGASWANIETNTVEHLWGITSWGDGALIGGDEGLLLSLSSPDDRYWAGTVDSFAPPPPAIDPVFEPLRAAAVAERERVYADAYAVATAQHDQISVKAGLSRPSDANPRLARLVEEAADGDVTAAQVYADWLQSEGDPRGELAAIQLQRAMAGNTKELEAAERALLGRHVDRFLGRLAPIGELVELQWHAGFIRSARVATTYDNDSTPERRVAIEDVVSWVLDAPSARFLRELAVGMVTYSDNDYTDVNALIGQRYLPALRELVLGDFYPADTEVSWSRLGDVEPIYAALPNLAYLRLRSGSMRLGTIVLPHLTSFAVETGGLDKDAITSICEARWPGLRSLSLQIGSADYGSDVSLDDLRPILDATGLPRLVHLGLANTTLSDELIEPLATSRLLPQLETLDLGLGTLSDDGVERLFRYQKAFAHLRELAVADNYITEAGRRLLAQTSLAVELGEQRDDGGEPENRYVAVAE